MDAPKFILINHADGNSPDRVVICDTEAQRDIETLIAVFGTKEIPPSHADEAAACLRVMRADKILTFEGDPPIRWLTATVETKSLREITARQSHEHQYREAREELRLAKPHEVADIEDRMAYLEAKLQLKGIRPGDL